MPQNKHESLIYTVMMCFVMVLWMSFYNVFIRTLKFDTSIFTEGWLGFPLAYIVALCVICYLYQEQLNLLPLSE